VPENFFKEKATTTKKYKIWGDWWNEV